MRSCQVLEPGRVAYAEALQLQRQLTAQRKQGLISDRLLLLEHPHTITLGRNARAGNILAGDDVLARTGISVFETDRGGDVTYHGPGQLVGYPLLSLNPLRPDRSQEESFSSENDTVRPVRSDYVGYVRKLEKTLIVALARLGVVAGQRSGLTGVWVQADVHSRCLRCRPEDKEKPAKIAAIGVKVDARGVSRHGFALNVNPDMEYWDGIIACGLSEPVVSLADLFNPVPAMERVKKEVITAFREVFE